MTAPQEDFHPDALAFAFGFEMATRIVSSDGTLGADEQAFLDRHFPAATFAKHGFRDPQGQPTQRWHDALGEAGYHEEAQRHYRALLAEARNSKFGSK